MTERGYTESVVEQAAQTWLESVGGRGRRHGAEIVPWELAAKRADYRQVVLVQRLRDALGRLNAQLPAEAIDDAFPKVTHPERPTLEGRMRLMHQGVFST